MIGATITKLRKQRKLTQAKFAEAIHVTQAAVSQWETGKTNPDFQQMFILADFFGVSIEELSSGNLSTSKAGKSITREGPIEIVRFTDTKTEDREEKLAALYKALQKMTDEKLDKVRSIIELVE